MLFRYLLSLFLFTTAVLNAQTDSILVVEPEEVQEAIEEGVDVPADDPDAYIPPAAKPVAMRDVKDDQWAKAASGLDYSKDVPEPPKPEKEKKQNNPSAPNIDWGGLGSFLGQILQIIAIIAAIIGLAYGIYKAMNAPRNRQIARDGVEITLDNVEQYIHESDLDHFLREALAAGNYALAIRLYYLQVIKHFSETGAIRWSREKTNRDYLRETRNHRSADAFRVATRIYERVWYGNQPVDEAYYRHLEPSFRALLS